ncbi:periplasmic binding protein-like II [Mycena sanguinolenta]|nr:periplasmic binding protein-like II [Mycena sanguinolenta]
MVLRVGYVREHFSTPLLQFQDADQNATFSLVECPSGTGQLISRLTKDEIDVAIALTDPLISGIANGSTAYKLCGSYVSTPLNWAVITGKDTKFKDISDLKGTTIGISRLGSGSQTMAYVMALKQGWPTDDLKFQINNDIRGLIDSVNNGSTSAFMWEWFTTKPFVDAGEARFIGSVPTPWPSWLIAAHPTRASPEALRAFMSSLSGYVRAFNSTANRDGPNVEVIKTKFGYPEEDIKAWLKTVAYPENCLSIPSEVISHTLDVLEKAGVVKAPEGGFDVANFIAKDIVNLT